MRFTLIKDLKKENTMAPLLVGMLVFFFLYLCADFVVKQYGFGLFESQIKITLFGNEEEFIEGMVQSAFLEYMHGEIFFTMMLLLTLCAVYVRVAQDQRYKLSVLNITMLSALLTPVSLFTAYFYNAAFLPTYIATFFSWHLFALFMILSSLQRLLFAKSI
jgi:magnesium-transporting ATPase (P-type)